MQSDPRRVGQMDWGHFGTPKARLTPCKRSDCTPKQSLRMLAKKAISGLVTGKRRRLGFDRVACFSFPFSSKAGDVAPSARSSSESLNRQTRSFSSETGSPPRQPPAVAPGTDYLSLFQAPSYGNALTGLGAFSPGSVLKVYPLPRFVLKEDVIRHLEGSNLQEENVKFVYNPTFRPDYVQFDVDSAATRRQIMRRLQERGRLGCRFLKAEMSPPMPWTVVDAALKDSPRGRTLLMYNVSSNTDFEDVERFFSGYNFDASYIRFIKVNNEPAQNRNIRRPVAIHVAVGFTTRLEAFRAMREKMGDFCANVAVNLRLIQ